MYEHFCLFLTKQMCFQKEHDLAQDYFSNIDENLGFTNNVSTSKFCYYVSFKKNNVDYDLASEVWSEFKYRIDKAPSCSEFDFELVVFS